eukprot:1144780-Amphidinium_carterae.1
MKAAKSVIQQLVKAIAIYVWLQNMSSFLVCKELFAQCSVHCSTGDWSWLQAGKSPETYGAASA